MPITVWTLIPEHPAYSIIGFVTSENLLPKLKEVEHMPMASESGSNDMTCPPSPARRQQNSDIIDVTGMMSLLPTSVGKSAGSTSKFNDEQASVVQRSPYQANASQSVHSKGQESKDADMVMSKTSMKETDSTQSSDFATTSDFQISREQEPILQQPPPPSRLQEPRPFSGISFDAWTCVCLPTNSRSAS